MGLARAAERAGQRRSRQSEREKQSEGKQRETQRDGKSGREEQTEGEKQRGERERRLDLFSAAQWSFSSSGKTSSPSLSLFLSLHSSLTQLFCPPPQFISLSLIFHVLLFLRLPLCLLSFPLFFCISFSVPASLSLSLSYFLSPISALLSMASALCFPPPVFFFFFGLCSPRMHLFKACFTKTVLNQKERGRWRHAWVFF